MRQTLTRNKHYFVELIWHFVETFYCKNVFFDKYFPLQIRVSLPNSVEETISLYSRSCIPIFGYILIHTLVGNGLVKLSTLDRSK